MRWKKLVGALVLSTLVVGCADLEKEMEAARAQRRAERAAMLAKMSPEERMAYMLEELEDQRTSAALMSIGNAQINAATAASAFKPPTTFQCRTFGNLTNCNGF